MFQPQPTPFSSFYSSYLNEPLDGCFPPQQQQEDNGLQVDDSSYVQAQAQAQQAAVQAGGFSSYHQQPTFTRTPASVLGSDGLEYQSQSQPPVINPCPGPVGLGSTAGGGHGGAAGVGAVQGPLSLSLPPRAVQQQQQQQQQVQVGSIMGLGFPLHSAIPHPQHQLPLSATGPSLFDHNPSPSNLHHRTSRQQQQQKQHQHQHQRQSQSHQCSIPHRSIPRPGTKMEADQSVQDDLAAQEAAARTWQPELEGPRVGDKTPIGAITAEYERADPVYVAKTMALPQTYTHYRPIKGDGSCGWRAIVFSYFELLIEQGSRQLLQGEEFRIRELNNYLVNSGGYDPEMFMDFTDETFELFKHIEDNIESPEVAHAILETKFNDDSSMGLLYHFRILAASWLKGNRDQYEAWCELGVDQYVQSVIDPIDREIEELGVVLLVEVLLKPVGFTLEIAYLDRSAGTEVNTHRFPESTANIGGPFIHLLYRPGHYDILYKPNTMQAIQVNRVSYESANFAPAPQFTSSFDYNNPIMMIPGMGSLGGLSNPMGQLGGPSLDFSPSPQSPWFPNPCADSSPAPSTPQVAQPPSYPTPQQEPLPMLSPQPTVPGPSTQHEIRFSRYQYAEAMDGSPWPEQSFQTSMFKNSHFNKAHYNNPDFTPEAYNPDADDVSERPQKPKKKGHGKGGRQSSEDSTDSKRERK
ncbi:unnamed protein product [Discula destructiva]